MSGEYELLVGDGRRNVQNGWGRGGKLAVLVFF
jgi:hypothetical protein